MLTFLGLEEAYSTLESARYCVLKIPYEKTTTYRRGAQFGPDAIIRASIQVELYDEELDAEPFYHGIATEDVPLLQNAEPEIVCLDRIEKKASELLALDKFVVGIGGEHTVSLPLVKAHLNRFGQFTVLQIDAHADLRQRYIGSPLNHACVMARIYELTDCVGVGIRSISREEADWVAQKGYRIWYAHQIQHKSDWIDQVISQLSDKVYITIDVDGLDPSFMPATGTPEPGGLFWWQTLYFLRRVFQERQVVGCDVVEFSPIEGYHSADFLAARLVYKLIGYHAESSGKLVDEKGG